MVSLWHSLYDYGVFVAQFYITAVSLWHSLYDCGVFVAQLYMTAVSLWHSLYDCVFKIFFFITIYINAVSLWHGLYYCGPVSLWHNLFDYGFVCAVLCVGSRVQIACRVLQGTGTTCTNQTSSSSCCTALTMTTRRSEKLVSSHCSVLPRSFSSLSFSVDGLCGVCVCV